MLALGLAGCASLQQSPPPLLLTQTPPVQVATHDADAFFAAMAITPDQRAQFVAGDNRAGYYEGWTHGYRGGVGYRIGEASLFEDRAAFIDGRRLPREAAQSERIVPFGHCVEHAGARDCLLLHSGRAALSLRVESETAAELSLLPLWGAGLAGYRLELAPGALLLVPPAASAVDGHPDWIAISADQSLRIETAPRLTRGDRDVLQPSAQAPWLRLSSAAPAERLTVHIAYADSRAQALAAARALAATDSWSAQRVLQHARLSAAELITPDADYNRALQWAQASALSFVVDQYGPGIWAGLPWFRDNWGRDTFIALPGTLLVSGQFEQARAVLAAFAERQQRDPDSPDYGRVPNRVATNQPTIYNTVDGTPWLLRAGLEYVRYSGDVEFAAELVELARVYIDGAQRHLDADGLLRHADADTWMDARVFEHGPAWSPRGDRAVEIQALWITALESAIELASAQPGSVNAAQRADELRAWRDQAQRARAALLARFWDGARIADRLRADGSRDLARRPNALMLISVPWTPLLPEDVAARVLRDSVEHLLFPYGIASLDPAHPQFHPRHENPTFHHKDAAYHNGTVWGWNAGFTVTALNRYGQQALAWRLSSELARQILHSGTRGSMSELLDALPDATGQPRPSGTYAQSWSVAEFSRNAYQDYLGFRPNLLRNTLALVPALPEDWHTLSARLPFGRSESLQLQVRREGAAWVWQFAALSGSARRIELDLLTDDNGRRRLAFELGAQPRTLRWDGRVAALDGLVLDSQPVMQSQQAMLQGLDLATPPPPSTAFPMLRGRDVLRAIVSGDQSR
ncbi:amylo-alpha-1,6-glucosidase [Aquimonas sp.]|jgi:glycogen debranching enzyme|uniref:amylo-alpha-1,6-glucosidase n=1 Tax=Aquimonas sp. TaxID=1872588 RepID=UPI0037C0F1B4